MAYAHLDEAAKESGKSEVTLRRLIKAGKVSHKKEKTHSGFIYLVDPVEVKSYYAKLAEASDIPVAKAAPAEEVAEPAAKPEKAPKGEESYWRGRAEVYEEKYVSELNKTAELREELGQWRGRAEQAQGMLIKLLPAPDSVTSVRSEPEVEVSEKPSKKDKDAAVSSTAIVMVVLFAAAFILIAVGTFLNLR